MDCLAWISDFKHQFPVIILLLSYIILVKSVPSLPKSHLPYYLRNHLEELETCYSGNDCFNISRESVIQHCWGYESQCKLDYRFQVPSCPGNSKGWTTSKGEQEKTFFKQADFGYIRDIKKEITAICKASKETDSSLECSSNTRFCRGSKIFIKFGSLMKIPEPMKYREDVLQDGDIGGFGCNLNQQKLKIQGGHKSPLQSWFDEMEHFTAFEKQSQVQCDITIEKPTFIVKLDATVNMYHHFCDFVNLYLTMHLNNSLQSLDRSNVLIWDTIPYRSNFAVSWEAFLKDVNVDLLDLSGFRGKTICFNDIVFSLLPRMVFGMYYNMPLIPGCHKSGVFQAFRDHMIHRLNIRDSFQYLDSNTQKPRNEIRITIIVRNTKYRKIINLEELVKTLRMKSKRFNVKTIDFSHQMPFKKQLEVTANTDILIGMHGAGLTHTLFLPDYAVLFELFNCDDENCYKDLSRLRGVKYMTWEKRSLVFPEDEGKHPTLGTSHAKFTNYAFDPKEFLRLVLIAVKHVKAERSLFIQTKLGITIDDARDEL